MALDTKRGVKMPKKKSSKARTRKRLDAQKLVVRLYRDYASKISKNLWPWEKARWYELVFCILATAGEPQVLAGTTRQLSNTMANLGLLELDLLAGLDPSEKSKKTENPFLVTIETLLLQIGFTPGSAKSAVTAICEAAASIKKKYDGKIQNYLCEHGNYMLDQIKEDFGFSRFDDARRAISIWLQNTLNMPIPASDPLTDQACKSLGFLYEELVEAANQQDINVALLDDALRAFWERVPASEKTKVSASQ